MATTSIWRVKGWLGKVVLYVENPYKTTNPAFFDALGMGDKQLQGLVDVIAYATNSEKTGVLADENAQAMQDFVSGINCYPGTAREEMLAVKKRFGKEDGTIAYHGYQSFGPGEATPSLAHQIGVELASRLWGDRYQVVVATHLDKENHLHNHFVVNTVSFVDGMKYHRTRQDYLDMRRVSDELCRKYRLSVITDPQSGRTKHYGEWQAEKEKHPTWRGLIKADIEEAIGQSLTERQFYDVLRKKGYEVKIGADISVRPPGKERFLRLGRNFGEEYLPEGIRKRILAQRFRVLPEPGHKRNVCRVKPKGRHRYGRKVTGLRALYLHYCYLLGYFPKKNLQHIKHYHFLLREDIRKMDAISKEVQLLIRHRIDTAEQLSSYKSGLEEKADVLAGQRNELYRRLRTVAVKTDAASCLEVRKQITVFSKELAVIRREVRLCEDIAIRSGVMKEKIEVIRQENKEKGRKEKMKDEQCRRCSGADR